jgi:hypothetical protein
MPSTNLYFLPFVVFQFSSQNRMKQVITHKMRYNFKRKKTRQSRILGYDKIVWDEMEWEGMG